VGEYGGSNGLKHQRVEEDPYDHKTGLFHGECYEKGYGAISDNVESTFQAPSQEHQLGEYFVGIFSVSTS
jgi:hypothetical protein